MEITNTTTFNLVDRSGVEHRYTTTAITPSRGGDSIVRDLSALLSEPLAPIAIPYMMGKQAEGLDNSAIGRGVKQALRELDMKLIRRILAETTRDGEKLRDDNVYDAAYTRNYAELLGVLKEVITYNGFLDFLSFGG